MFMVRSEFKRPHSMANQPPPARSAGFPGAPPKRPLSRTAREGLNARPNRSAAGDGVTVADPFGQPALAPGLAAILRPEHLANARDREDLVCVLRMRHDAHHRRLGLDAVVEALPGAADI